MRLCVIAREELWRKNDETSCIRSLEVYVQVHLSACCEYRQDFGKAWWRFHVARGYRKTRK